MPLTPLTFVVFQMCLRVCVSARMRVSEQTPSQRTRHDRSNTHRVGETMHGTTILYILVATTALVRAQFCSTGGLEFSGELTHVTYDNAGSWQAGEDMDSTTLNVWVRPLSASGYGDLVSFVDQEERTTGFGFTSIGVYSNMDGDYCEGHATNDYNFQRINWFARDLNQWTMWTVVTGSGVTVVYRNGVYLHQCASNQGFTDSFGYQSVTIGRVTAQVAEFQFVPEVVTAADVLAVYRNASRGVFDGSFSLRFTKSNGVSYDETLEFSSAAPVFRPCHCSSEPCHHSGVCADGLPGFSNCTCVTGYTGYLCQTDINECGSSPCTNGGTCHDMLNGFNCTCLPGWSGVRCQTNINECASSPCRNGATCIDATNGFSCTCVIGYAGTTCQTDINECASSPCTNGRTCIDGVNSYRCVDGTEPYCLPHVLINDTAHILTSAPPGAGGTTLDVEAPLTLSFWLASVGGLGGDPDGFLPNHFVLVDRSVTPPQRGISVGLGFTSLGLTFWYDNEGCSASTVTPRLEWTHYMATAAHTGSRVVVTLYVNGVRVSATHGVCELPFVSIQGKAISVEVGRAVHGTMSNVRYWPRVLTALEITDDVKFRSHYPTSPGPRMWFALAEQPALGANFLDVSIGTLALDLYYYGGASPLPYQHRQCACATQGTCSANATCIDNPNTVVPCNCSIAGYTGYTCATNTNECASGPCQNGATCVDGVNSFSCNCRIGFRGTLCNYSNTTLLRNETCSAPANSTVYTAMTPALYRVMAQHCDTEYAKARVFDPTNGWCVEASRTVNATEAVYRNLQQNCYESNNRLLSVDFWRGTQTCLPFGGWGSNILPYFQSLCEDGYAYDFSQNICVLDEREERCGLHATTCSKRCFANNTCTTHGCRCSTGATGDRAYCNYKIDTDFCPAATGLSGTDESRSAICGVFTEESFYDCTTSQFQSNNCTEDCRCKLGTGDTLGSTRKCRGQEVTCSAQNSLDHCGVADGRCVKLCEFEPPFTHPQYCAFVPGSCGSVAQYPTSQACVAANTIGYSEHYTLLTYRYNATRGGITAQQFHQDAAAFTCLCDTAHTGMKCSFTNCPEGCDEHGTCVSGHCSCSAPWTGCGCQIEKYPLCTTDGAVCINATASRPECEICTDTGTCAPQYAADGITPSYACSCDVTHEGEFCADPVCPNDCGGASHGQCEVPGGNKTRAFCECRSSGTCTSGNNIYAGADCADNVCDACGMLEPGGTEKLLCAGNGQCLRANMTVPYACVCTSGFTGTFCQNPPCDPVCGLNTQCVSDETSYSCQCDLGYTDKVGGTTCVTNKCGSRATPFALGSGYGCRCNDPDKDQSRCVANGGAVTNEAECCVNAVCPSSGGIACGSNAQNDPYGFIPVPVCTDGTCVCGNAYTANSTSGTCFPFCDQSRLAPSADPPCNYADGESVCSSCSCEAGYDPVFRCYESSCKNGATLVVTDATTFFCNCDHGWSGTFCDQPPCGGVGAINTTTGVCQCPFPYTGDACATNACQNGGAVSGTACSCPAKWGGSTCSENLCAPGGAPAIGDGGATCACGAAYTGPLCATSACQNGGTLVPGNNTDCNCTNAGIQYHGATCSRRVCGPLGTLQSSGVCTCPANGYVALDSTTNNCTRSLCGAHGTLVADHLSCVCEARTTVRTPATLTAAHPVICEPQCGPLGRFDTTTQGCVCNSTAAVGRFCDIASSSTGIRGPLSSTGASSHAASENSPKPSTLLFLFLVLYASCMLAA